MSESEGRAAGQVSAPSTAPQINGIGSVLAALPAAAEWYATQWGWAVFPCRPRAKTPMTPNGFKDASRDVNVIRSWWAAEPNANIGVPTGAINGLVVVDVDPDKGGFRSMVELERRIGRLQLTLQANTPRGGLHMFFSYPAGVQHVQCRVDMLDGVDVRADGGYVVVAPSVVDR